MRKILIFIGALFLLTSCGVSESIVFNADGSGEFLVTYNMGDAMSAMKNSMGSGNEDKKKGGKVMDSTMYFSDLMENYKDSIATLPQEKQLAFELVKDMYMNMKMNEDENIMDVGMGFKFNSIEDLDEINKKLKAIKELNEQGEQLNAVKNNSPIGKFMGDDNGNTKYTYNKTGFSRVSIITEEAKLLAKELDNSEGSESDAEFMAYFENSNYTVKYTFPKEIKSVSKKDAVISEDKKTVTFAVNWIDYLKNPLMLDLDVTFEDE